MRKLALAALLALVLAPEAAAKSCVKMSLAPAPPVAGARVEIRLTTWRPAWPGGGRVRFVEPIEMPKSYRLTVTATSPGGEAIEIRLNRDATRTHLWRAPYTFAEAGRWLVKAPRLWNSAPRACALPMRFTVRPR